MKSFFYLTSYLVLILYLGACSCSGSKNQTDSQWTTDMASQNSVKAQEGGKKGELLMRLSPEGSRARNRSYYPYPKDPVAAGRNLKNPLSSSPEVLLQGQKHYQRYCIYCHGTYGDAGKGASVAPKMLVPPASLLTDKAKAYSDGRIYHIIYQGQGLMGAYNLQLETNEQALMSRYIKEGTKAGYTGSKNIWSLVHYVRALQQKKAMPTSIKKKEQ